MGIFDGSGKKKEEKPRADFLERPVGQPTGKYKVEVFLNDQSADTKTFDVSS